MNFQEKKKKWINSFECNIRKETLFLERKADK